MFEISSEFEKRNEDNQIEVLVIQVAKESSVNSPKLDKEIIKEVCSLFGINPKDLEKLLNTNPDFQDFEGVEEPIDFQERNEKGEVEEDIHLWTVNLLSIGKTEVSINGLYPAATKPVDNVSLHLTTKPKGEKGDFEILYGLKGSFTLTFPQTAEPIAAGVYGSSDERENIEVKPGVLVFIRAPNPNGWTALTKEPCIFEYICNPPWNKNIVRKTLDLPPTKL